MQKILIIVKNNDDKFFYFQALNFMLKMYISDIFILSYLFVKIIKQIYISLKLKMVDVGEKSIQQKLMQSVPEFRQKKDIIQYYVGFQFPEKQFKMVDWWGNMIKLAIEKSGEIYLSPAKLEVIFAIHGLKPIPLANILAHLSSKDNTLQWRNKPENQQKGLLSNIWGYMWKQQNKSSSIANDIESKIINKQYLNQLIKKTKKIITNNIGTEKSIPAQVIQEQLKTDCKISYMAINFLFEELEAMSWMKIGRLGDKKMIYYSDNAHASNNQQWIKIQNSKYMLKKQIQRFNLKVNRLIQSQQKIKEKAKILLEQQKSEAAKKLLSSANPSFRQRKNLQTKIKALQQVYFQLQNQETTESTFSLLQNTQTIISQMEIDSNKVDEMTEKSREIKQKQRYFEDRLKNAREQDEQENQQDVEDLMKILQQEIQDKKKTKEKQKPVKVIIPEEKTWDKKNHLKQFNFL